MCPCLLSCVGGAHCGGALHERTLHSCWVTRPGVLLPSCVGDYNTSTVQNDQLCLGKYALSFTFFDFHHWENDKVATWNIMNWVKAIGRTWPSSR